jgi:hypothetical protein
LTGNPCTDFEGYRKYVIVTLPQLKNLDGQEIERSERIQAAQEYDEIKKFIVHQEQQYKGLYLGTGVPRGAGVWGVQTPPEIPRSFEKAWPNSQFRGIYICNNLIRIQVSFIYKLRETQGATAPRSPFCLPSVLS